MCIVTEIVQQRCEVKGNVDEENKENKRDVDARTFMSAGNSSFFTRPVAATMFPIAPVVFSATVCKHTQDTCDTQA